MHEYFAVAVHRRVAAAAAASTGHSEARSRKGPGRCGREDDESLLVATHLRVSIEKQNHPAIFEFEYKARERCKLIHNQGHGLRRAHRPADRPGEFNASRLPKLEGRKSHE